MSLQAAQAPPAAQALSPAQIDEVIRLALAEDVPFGDLTTECFVPAEATAEAHLIAREPGIFSGGEVFSRTMTALDSTGRTEQITPDGARFDAGQRLATVRGPARAILTAERTTLNLVQRMSGIATLTAEYVWAVRGTGARIVDTRKTTPGLRALERHAVRSGGGHNHRFCLSDAVLAKDNHLAMVAAGDHDLSEALRRARARLPHTTHLEVEVDRVAQIPAALDGGADTIMMDNFSLEDLRRGVELIGGRALAEASGGVTLPSVEAIAQTGVDLISVGALTHSAPALDLGLDFR